MMEAVGEEKNKDLFMTEEQFALIKGLVCREFGIIIKGDKRLTIHMKIAHRLGILGINSYSDYYNYVVSDPSGEELFSLVSHITNNETYFMREKTQLNVFSGLLPEVKKNRQKKNSHSLSVLSAGCSSGEEAYTINILLMESGLFAWGWEASVTGMDVSKAAIKRARRAEYSKNSFRAINGNGDFIKKYFERADDKYTLKRPYKSNVRFVHSNLLKKDAFEGLTGLDVIFCRNILIYMTDEAIESICRNFHGSLDDGGYLILGSSESLIGKTDLFVPEYKNGIIIYRKNTG